MPTTPDPHVDETTRVYAEYDTARALWENDRTDPLAKARFDRAQVAVQQTRDFWRQVGHVTGDRDPDSWVKVVHNEDTPPTLIPQEA